MCGTSGENRKERPNSPALTRKVILGDGGRCGHPLCRRFLKLHAHHVRFRSAGGTTAVWNEVALCAGAGHSPPHFCAAESATGWEVTQGGLTGGYRRGPSRRPAGVMQVRLRGVPVVEETLSVYPNIAAQLLAECAAVTGLAKKQLRCMEKFGEWKHVIQVGKWQEDGCGVWTVNAAVPGDYMAELTYRGEGRMARPPGTHALRFSLIDGDRAKVSLSALCVRATE